MKRWVGAILVFALAAVAVMVSVTPAGALEQEVTAIAPGGNYHVYVTVNKPTNMSLSSDWEIRFYYYSGTSCFNHGSWWEVSPGSWIYSGYYGDRVRNEVWTTPDEKTFDKWVKVVNYPRGSEGPAYPLEVGENYKNKMDDLPLGGTVTLRARLMFRNLTPKFEGEYVAFKIAGADYRYKFKKDSYDRYWIKTPEDKDVGSGAYLDQSEGTGEWRLNYRADKDLLVDNTALTSGKIIIPSTITLGLSPVGLEIPIWMILAGGIILVVVIAAIFLTRRGKGEELPQVPEYAPPPPPEAPPAPPEAPPSLEGPLATP